LALIEGIFAEFLFADKGYDTNEILEYAGEMGIKVVIPPKKNRVEQREYDKFLYKHRHLVENAFLKLKRWRGVATRYAKTISSFVGAVNLAAIVMWLRCLT
jgi:transposase